MRQNDMKKMMAYQKIFIGPLVWKCSTNDFELLLSENLNLKILLCFCIMYFVSILHMFWKFFNPFPGISDFCTFL